MLGCRQRHALLPAAGRGPVSFLGIGLESDSADGEPGEVLVLASSELRQALMHLDTEIDGRAAWEKVLDWFPDPDQFELDPPRPEGTGSSRPLGRLALWAGRHQELVGSALVRRLGELVGYSTSLYDRRVDVLLLASAWGGTGSALAFDVANLCQRLGRLGRQDLLLALPSVGEPASYQNAFAALLDLIVARRQPTTILGGLSSSVSQQVHGVTPRLERHSPDLEPLLAAVSSDAVEDLVEIATARLQSPLVSKLDRWRQQVMKVSFGPRPLAIRSRLHSAAATSLSLVRLEAQATDLAATLEEREFGEEEVTGGNEERGSAKVSVEEPAPDAARLQKRGLGKAVRRFSDQVSSLLTEVLEHFKTWSREQTKGGSSESGKSQEMPDPLSPLFSSFEKADRPEAMRSLLRMIGRETLYSDLEEIAEITAKELGRLPRDSVEKAIRRLDRESRKRLPQDHPPIDRLAELETCIAEMRRFTEQLDATPWYRRLPLSVDFRRRNDEICRHLEAEALELQDWPRALDPLLRLTALRLLEYEIAKEPAMARTSEVTPLPFLEETSEPAVLEGVERRAFEAVVPEELGDGELDDWLAGIEGSRDEQGAGGYPIPMRRAYASC